MTDQEKKQRIKEIDHERDKLRDEREEYITYFVEQDKAKKLSEHKAYEGKCFKLTNSSDTKNKYMQAIKIIKVLEDKQDYADCLIIADGFRDTAFKEIGVYRKVIGVWLPDRLSIMAQPTAPKVIDYYTEISEKEFNLLKDGTLRLLENN